MALTLKAARVNRGLTQDKAAVLIGVSTNTISKWESGKTFPSTKWLPKIEQVYGIRYDDIIFLPKNYALSVIKSDKSEQNERN